MNAQTHAVDRDDIQGLLRSGYGHHTEACFLLLRISDLQAARTWLRAAPVTSVAQSERSAGPLPGPATAPVYERERY